MNPDSSVGRAMDCNARGSWFDPQQNQFFFNLGLVSFKFFSLSNLIFFVKRKSSPNIIIIRAILSQYSHRNNLWTILAQNSHCGSIKHEVKLKSTKNGCARANRALRSCVRARMHD